MTMNKFTQVKGCKVPVVRNYGYVEKNPLVIDVKRIIAGTMAGSFLIAIGLTASCYIG